MKKRALFFLVFLLALCAAGCVHDSGPDSGRDLSLVVMLTEGEGYTITSQNPVRVQPGGTASFEVEVDPTYIIDSVDRGAVFDGSRIILENVNYPTTIKMASRPRELYIFEVRNDPKYGTVTSSKGSHYVYEGTEITLTAKPKSGSMFLGFSDGGLIRDGGEIVSYSTEYTFEITGNIDIYANYAQEGSKVIVYKANGGRVPNSSLDSIFVEVANSHYICPNTLYDGGNFVREGYVLYGYNTEPDGSGRYYGLGWNIVMPETGLETLYAQWIEETEPAKFKYTTTGGNVKITGYTGDDDIVVIPEYIGGNPVTSIAPKAFSNCSFSTLVFSKNLKIVAAGAVVNCPNFTTLYMSDSIMAINDNFYQNCPNFSKLYMNATQAPRYISSRNGTYQIKFERLMTAPGKKLIVTGGSNVAYGVISEQLMAGLDNEYSVVNYGCNASTPASFYIEVISHFINEGDILVHAPENNKYQWGYNEVNTTLWQIFEGAYDAFSYVDIRNYIAVFSSFSSFNSGRQSRKANTYENYTSETVNMYGDYIKEKVGQTYTPSVKKISLSASLITSPYNQNLNRSLDMVTAAGGKCYLSFATINFVTLTDAARTLAQQTQYMNAAKTNIHATLISKPGDYLLDTKYFYNSDYHLNTEGAKVRTDLLTRDIKAQLAKEK
jgi:hypothetical protein